MHSQNLHYSSSLFGNVTRVANLFCSWIIILWQHFLLQGGIIIEPEIERTDFIQTLSFSLVYFSLYIHYCTSTSTMRRILTYLHIHQFSFLQLYKPRLVVSVLQFQCSRACQPLPCEKKNSNYVSLTDFKLTE